MKQQTILALILIATVNVGFKANQKAPKLAKSSALIKTDFCPTLEHEFSKSRNAIYCSSMLYAWNEIRTVIKKPIQINSSLHDLYLINNSTSYKNTLKKDEYFAKGEVRQNLITLKSKFKKSLPFKRPFYGNSEALMFGDRRVSSFGIDGYPTNQIEIAYYQADNNFIIKIALSDEQHEIILSMSPNDYTSMADIITNIQEKIKVGNLEKQNKSMEWKYTITEYDMVSIPALELNAETSYSKIEGNKFTDGVTNFEIGKAVQSIAFYLNEKGVKLDTDAITEVVFSEPVISEHVKPKAMRFNKPFFVMLKRVESANPYFGLWVANTELMYTHKF